MRDDMYVTNKRFLLFLSTKKGKYIVKKLFCFVFCFFTLKRKAFKEKKLETKIQLTAETTETSVKKFLCEKKVHWKIKIGKDESILDSLAFVDDSVESVWGETFVDCCEHGENVDFWS